MRLVGLSRGRGWLLGAVGAACAVAGCSGSSTASSNTALTVSGKTLTIYAARPLAGGQASNDVYDAEELGFQQSGGKAGKYRLVFKGLNEPEVSADARQGVSDNTAIAYLGEIEPGQSGISTQITNELGLLQISPTDTAAYLTKPVSGTDLPADLLHSPGHWYPAKSNFGETFARVVPTTAAEATALVKQMQVDGVKTLAVGSDGSDYGATIAAEVRAAARTAGITVGRSSTGADGFFFGGSLGGAAGDAAANRAAASAATKALDAAAPAGSSIKLFAPSGLYDANFISGLSSAARSALTVSAPGFTAAQLRANPTAEAFTKTFTRQFGHAPAPQAIFGYEAVQALVATLTKAGAQAASRTDVVKDFRSLQRSQSALGSYTLSGGDTSIAPFVMAKWVGGKLVPRAQG